MHDCWAGMFTCANNLVSVPGQDGTYELTLTGIVLSPLYLPLYYLTLFNIIKDIFLAGQGADTGLMLYSDSNNFIRFDLHFYSGNDVSSLIFFFFFVPGNK
jgi:hypothetical protein